MRLIEAWRLPIRIARRDALRHRGRSALALTMIALPVLGVTTAAVLISTSDVSAVESIDRRIGAAQALVMVQQGSGAVFQSADPISGSGFSGDGTSTEMASTEMASADEVSALLDGARLVELRTVSGQVSTDAGRAYVEMTEVDLSDPISSGLFDLTAGRLPSSGEEVVVNQAMLDKGYAVGGTLKLSGDGAPAPRIVGVAESTSTRSSPTAAGPLGSLGPGPGGARSWLVDGGPVSWATVLQLNKIGATVTSRAVIEDPPATSELAPQLQYSSSDSGTTAAIVALIVTMALIEVVLLAGPSFAVGARKQQRSLALIAACGGTPAQARRVILAGALVLGSTAAVLGVGFGIVLARLLVPLVQSFSGEWLGPFDIAWLPLLGVAFFGLASAFLAALVPAWLASRHDVVAVLAGRRGDRPPSLRSPLVGLVLVGLGTAATASGAGRQSGGEMLIAAGTIPAVLGMILLIPVVLALLARVSGRLPLFLRYAVRDANRHRSRTVPAVAAVAATVAGVVALGIGLASDEAESEATYSASLPAGMAMVIDSDPAADWTAISAVVARVAPEAPGTRQQGLAGYDSYVSITAADKSPLLASSGSSLGSSVMVDDSALPIGLTGLSSDQVSAAQIALGQGQAVVFANNATETEAEVRMVNRSFDPGAGEGKVEGRVRTTALLMRVPQSWVGPQAVVPTDIAEQLGGATTVGLVVGGPRLTENQETSISEGLVALGGEFEFSGPSIYVERGFQTDSETLIAQLVLIGLGAVLMLGGTLTATFLALSDARPDLATLSAVGASPRTRRAIASAYAVVVGGVGAFLGAAVGFIPGIAVTWPLTSQSGNSCFIDGSGSCVADGSGTGPFLDVPWLMIIGLVVVLPLLTALVVGLFARSRLPLVARLG